MSASFPRGQNISADKDKKSLKRSVVETAPFGKKRAKVVEVTKHNGDKKASSGVVVPSIGLGLVGDSKLVKVDAMTFGKLSPGCVVLGYILQVEESRLLVSLPGGFTGQVAHAEVSDVVHEQASAHAKGVPALSTLVKPQQAVRCYILGLSEKANSKKKTINLSMRSSLINKGLAMKHFLPGFAISGCVASKEDHGYIIATGVPAVNCFVLFKDIPTAQRDMVVGQPVECVATTISEAARTVNLRIAKKATNAAVIQGSGLTFNALTAGMMVNSVVAEKVKNGIVLSFLGLFRGVVDALSVERGRMEGLTAGDVVQARIVHIDHANKTVRLSMKSHVLELRPPANLPDLGSVVEGLTVVEVLRKSGVLLVPTSQLETADDEEGASQPTLFYMNKHSLADQKEDREDADADAIVASYKVNDSIDAARVRGYNLVEGWVVASNEQAFMEQKVLHHEDVSVGQLVDVTIASVRDFGLVVKVGKGITAICPTMHTADIVVDGKVKKTLKAGQRCAMRVWEKDGSAVVMTNKKSLVELRPEATIKAAEDASVGMTTTGLVSKINLKEGVTVRFFNKVKGLLPLSMLAKQGVLDPAAAFRIGQVVKVVVVKRTETGEGKAAKAPLTLGLDLNVSPEAVVKLLESDSAAAAAAEGSAAAGNGSEVQFVSGTVSKVSEDSATVVLEDGRPAKIHRHHLFDFAATADAVFGSETSPFKAGHKIAKALVLSEYNGVLNLTCKPLLLHAAERVAAAAAAQQKSSKKEKRSTADILAGSAADEAVFPRLLSELVPGKTVVGFVSKVESYGVQVRFRESLSALAPRVNIADKFVNTPVDRFVVGDSIRCVVQRVDLVKERTIVTLKASIVTPSLGKSNYLSASLSEACAAARAAKPETASIESFLRSSPLSSVVKAKVASVQEYGVVLTAPDNRTVIHVKSPSSPPAVGSSVKVITVDVDYATSVVSAVLSSDLQSLAKVKALTAASSGGLSTATSAVIIAKQPKYLVVVTSAGVLGYVAVADYHNPRPDMEDFKVGATIQVKHFHTSTDGADFPHSALPLFMAASSGADAYRAAAALVQKDAEESDLRLQKRLGGNGEEESSTAAAWRQKFIESLRVGYLTKWVVADVTPYEVSLLPENHEVLAMNVKAKLHISGAISPFHSADELRDSLNSVSSSVDAHTVHDRHPFYQYKKGALIWAYVLQVRRQTSGENSTDQDEFTVYCAKTFKTSEDPSAPQQHRGKKSAAATAAGSSDYVPFVKMPQTHGKDGLKCPSVVAGVVTKINKLGCVLSFSPYMSANLHFLDVSADPKLVALFVEKVHIGLKVVVLVTKLPAHNGKNGAEMQVSRVLIEQFLADFSSPADMLKDAEVSAAVSAGLKETGEYKEGQVVTGILNLRNHKMPKPPALMVGLKGAKFGRVCVTELSDAKDWSDMTAVFAAEGEEEVALPDGRAHGSVVQARVLAVNDKYVELSLRKSRVLDKKVSRATAADAVPEEGTLVKGFVANTSKKGCFVRLSSGLTGQVMMKDLAEEFVSDPVSAFPVGKLVTARLLSVSHVDSLARLSFKLTSRDSSAKSSLTAAEAGIEEGDTLAGEVLRITDFGVFVTLKDSGIVGLARKAAALSNANKSLEEEYSVGDTVKAKVLSVSANTQKIALGLSEHYFRHDDGEAMDTDEADEEDDEEEEDEDEDDSMDVDGDDSEEEEEAAPAPKKQPGKEFVFTKSVLSKSKKAQESDEEDSDAEDEDEDESSEGSDAEGEEEEEEGNGMVWDDFDVSKSRQTGDEEDEDEEEQEEAAEGKAGKQLRTRQKEAAARSAEQATYQREAALLDGSAVPQTQEDFDRLLIAQPNSSYLWVRLIAHHLEKADILTARGVATRALKTINFREENEKFNVWIAWLNLEHKYGTMESLTGVFDKAVSESKGKYIFLSLADIYEKAGDFVGAEAILQKALKRPQYKKSKKVWMAFHALKLRAGDVKGAKEQLARSLQSLSKHKHVEVISKYALAEFELGSRDRGRVVFEDLLNTYPKRSDLWHLYVDKEVKVGAIPQARQLFERMINSSTSTRNMKAVFKKYLAFEQAHGSEESVEAVKEKAREYVKSVV